jgi:mannitol-specific phosphotransferase system IIBC component
MNVREGTKRMKLLGMAMTLAPILAWVLFNLYEVQPVATHSGFGGFEYHFSLRILAAAIVLAVPGAIVWAAGWVVAGFAKEPK